MGDKTSHRRKNLKVRDPMARELEDPKYHQRIVEPKRHKKRKWDDDNED